LTDDAVAEALEGLPAAKYHCSNLAASALHQAILSYITGGPVASRTAMTVLVDDTAYGNFTAAHGLSLWIEYAGKKILFDTGPDDAVVKNARLLGVDLKSADAIVLSHGHYDHTGGLKAVLELAPNARVYVHPAALEPKFSLKDDL
jgi:7,8-dihydropterin-6-yl-methyl-4-(beta-D-ribofuranosyl)aminobenzene 5'-phosphate synthase